MGPDYIQVMDYIIASDHRWRAQICAEPAIEKLGTSTILFYMSLNWYGYLISRYK